MSPLDHVKMIAGNYRELPANVQEVQVIARPHFQSEQNQCFNNSFRELLSGRAKEDSKYVLGFILVHDGVGVVPIEHAWVKHGDQHVDVTLTAELIRPQDKHVSVVELSFLEVFEYVDKYHTAPGLYEMDRMRRYKK